MKIMNMSKGPRTLRNGVEIMPGTVATIHDDEWKALKSSPVTAGWLERGDLKEVAAGGTTDAVPEASVSISKTIATEAAVHPLDHDGDGKKGGSKKGKKPAGGEAPASEVEAA